jgi:hypothetical protein
MKKNTPNFSCFQSLQNARKNYFIGYFILFICLGISVNACKNDSIKKLANIEKQELAKGIRNDSLFMGLYLGMPKQDFFNHCWQMNKKGLFTDGSGQTVVYQLGKLYSDYPIQINFFPRFENDKISELPILFTYKTLDPYNPKMHTAKLMEEVKKLMEKWYGNGFFITPLSFSSSGKGYAKVTGNRRILIFVEKDFEVMVVISDLTAAID